MMVVFRVLTRAMDPEIPLGSRIYVEITDSVEDEDIVLCLYKGVLIVRTIRFYDHGIVLEPYNRRDYFPIHLTDPSKIKILGKVVTIMAKPHRKKWFDRREVFYVAESSNNALY